LLPLPQRLLLPNAALCRRLLNTDWLHLATCKQTRAARAGRLASGAAAGSGIEQTPPLSVQTSGVARHAAATWLPAE